MFLIVAVVLEGPPPNGRKAAASFVAQVHGVTLGTIHEAQPRTGFFSPPNNSVSYKYSIISPFPLKSVIVGLFSVTEH